jgi:membrane associated rhomboid family serine protease
VLADDGQGFTRATILMASFAVAVAAALALVLGAPGWVAALVASAIRRIPLRNNLTKHGSDF